MYKHRITNLIKKDFDILISNKMIYPFLVLYIVCLFVPFLAKFGTLTVCITFSFIFFTNHENGFGNETLLAYTLGVKKSEYLLSRYITLFILFVLSLPLSFYSLFRDTTFINSEITAKLVFISLIFIAIFIPLKFFLQNTKIDILILVSVVIYIFTESLFIMFKIDSLILSKELLESIKSLSLNLIFGIILLIFSYFLSSQIFNKKQLIH